MDEAVLFKGLEHIVHTGGRSVEEALHVALGRCLALDDGVCIDERQVLALSVSPCSGFVILAGHGHEGEYRWMHTEDITHEYTVSRDAERS